MNYDPAVFVDGLEFKKRMLVLLDELKEGDLIEVGWHIPEIPYGHDPKLLTAKDTCWRQGDAPHGRLLFLSMHTGDERVS